MSKAKLLPFIIGLIISTSQSTMASDMWDNCSSADGYVHLDNGILSTEALGEIPVISIQLMQKIETIKDMCILKQSQVEVIAYMNETTVEKVTYKIKGTAIESSIIMLCERGGSGLPAAEDCE